MIFVSESEKDSRWLVTSSVENISILETKTVACLNSLQKTALFMAQSFELRLSAEAINKHRGRCATENGDRCGDYDSDCIVAFGFFVFSGAW